MGQVQRKKHFIDARVQGSLVRRMFLHWLAFVMVAFVVSFILQVLADPFRPISAHLRELWWSHGPFLLVVVFLMPVYVVDTIKLSHRFAGPVFRIRRAIRRVAAGETPRPVKFRKNDFWQGLAVDYNAMLVQLKAVPDPSESEPAPAPDERLAASTRG